MIQIKAIDIRKKTEVLDFYSYGLVRSRLLLFQIRSAFI